MSNEKDPSCLGHFWGITLPSYVGIIIKHYKGPYKTASIMESNAAFFFSLARMEPKNRSFKMRFIFQTFNLLGSKC